MKNKNIFTNFSHLPYFTKQDLVIFAEHLSISDTTLDTLIQRAIKSKEIFALKRNYYVTKDFFSKHSNRIEYKYYLANILLKPSYITGETALQHYGLLSEAVMNYYTSISHKTTRNFKDFIGIFEYKMIKLEFFNGFKFVKFSLDEEEYSYAIAKPYKAIYDYLYYKTRLKNLNKEELFAILDDLRINYEDLPKSEIKQLVNMFK